MSSQENSPRKILKDPWAKFPNRAFHAEMLYAILAEKGYAVELGETERLGQFAIGIKQEEPNAHETLQILNAVVGSQVWGQLTALTTPQGIDSVEAPDGLSHSDAIWIQRLVLADKWHKHFRRNAELSERRNRPASVVKDQLKLARLFDTRRRDISHFVQKEYVRKILEGLVEGEIQRRQQ